MSHNILTPRAALNKAFLKVKPTRQEIEAFKANLRNLLNSINDNESEEFQKNLIIEFLKDTYYKQSHFINTKGRNDLVIHTGVTAKTNVGVIIETKKYGNKSEMVSERNMNTKAFQELVLYFLRERITQKNHDIKHLIITNIYEWYVFDVSVFERLVTRNKAIVKEFEKFESGKLAGNTTDFFYSEIAKPYIINITQELEYTYFDVRSYKKFIDNADSKDDNQLIALYKVLSPEHLLKEPFANDSNYLDKNFYAELLHIIGLTETKTDGKRLIERNKEGQRHSGSLLEDTISRLDALDKLNRVEKLSLYGDTNQERLFNVALTLNITWVNRILFLKLLEAQLITYHKGDKSYSFLSIERIKDFDDLNALFFEVLARQHEFRNADVKELFAKVPYLNSSLFEPTNIEHQALFISNLKGNKKIPILSSTVLKDGQGKKRVGELTCLEYLFDFLNAYDFSSEGGEEIQEENKALINASVLGLIFEKINGYKDGSFYTPGVITMYMCRETLGMAVLQKFKEKKGWDCKDLNELFNKIDDKREANQIINDIKICDPAVGSGHFLVSALNEFIAIKAELGLLLDKNGRSLRDYNIEVENDELIITDEDGKLFEYKPNNKESQRVQETLFHEKEIVIEKCLFGVDINPNSVKICRLRLWIELLKNAYYKNETELETLPNIDINIKSGNTLISRFALDADLSSALKKSKWTIDSYRLAVDTYRNAATKEEKREMEQLISSIKSDFRSEISLNDPKVKRLRKVSGDLAHLTSQSQLFEMNAKEKVEWDKKVKKLASENERLEAEINEIRNNKIYENAFEWRFEFPEILNDNGDFVGFDVLLGNPPYIRIQGIREADANMAAELAKRYKSATGSFDIYCIFVERGLSIIKTDGLVNYIMPVKWTNSSFGIGLRKILVEQSAAKRIINFGAHQAFDASTYTGLQWFSRNSSTLLYYEANKSFASNNELGNYLELLEESDGTKILSSSLSQEMWTLTENESSKIIEKLNLQPRRISDVFEKIFQGLATSKDDVYFLYNCKQNENEIRGFSKQLEKEVIIEKAFVKPLLKGEDVHRYEHIKTDRFVVFPYKLINGKAELYDENEISSLYPRAYRYLKECEDVLRDREKGRLKSDKHWYRYIYPKNLTLFANEKLVAPEISLGGNFSYDLNGEFYSTTKIYGCIKKQDVKEPYHFWLALFNSQLFSSSYNKQDTF